MDNSIIIWIIILIIIFFIIYNFLKKTNIIHKENEKFNSNNSKEITSKKFNFSFWNKITNKKINFCKKNLDESNYLLNNYIKDISNIQNIDLLLNYLYNI